MNRYEQYVPVKLDYKPYIPNFENWAKVLTQQQQKYDTFEQAFTLANPEHIKQDSGEYKIWQDYMQNTKDEVKNAFLKDAKYGNQKLKNKMFELQKEMQGGLYKGLETRHNEYQAASQQLSEGLKDQPEYRQWYFMNQFKANPMSYNKGEFNHINPVIVEKNPEVDKKIAEWTKTLVPAERSNEVVSMSPDGKWIINEKNLEAIIPKQVYQTKLREFLANTPEYNKDLQIRVAYNQAHRTPENENLLQAAHLQAVDLQRQQLTLDKDEYLNTKSQDKIKELQANFGLTPNGVRTKELDDKIMQQYAENMEDTDQFANYNPTQRDYLNIVKDLSDIYYQTITTNKKHHEIDMKANPYTVQEIRDNNAWARMKYHENAANKRAKDHNDLLRQQGYEAASQGTVVPTKAYENKLLAYDILNSQKEITEASKSNLINLIAAVLPGANNRSGGIAALTTNFNNTGGQLANMYYNGFNSLPQDIAERGEEQQIALMKKANVYDPNKPIREQLANGYKFKKGYEDYVSNASIQQSYDKVTKNSKAPKQIDEMLTTYVNNKELMDENYRPLSLKQVQERLAKNQPILSSQGDKTSFFGQVGNFMSQIPILSGIAPNPPIRDVSSELREQMKQIAAKDEKFSVENTIGGLSYVDEAPDSPYHKIIGGTFKPAILSVLKDNNAVDLISGGNAKVNVSEDSKVLDDISVSDMMKEIGANFDMNKMKVTTVFLGGKSGFNLNYYHNGKAYNVNVAVPKSAANDFNSLAETMYQTTSLADKPDAANTWSRIHGYSTGQIPFNAFNNKDIKSEDAFVHVSKDHTTNTKVLNPMNVSGIQLGTLSLNGSYYSGIKNTDGSWSILNVPGLGVINKADPTDVMSILHGKYEMGGRAMSVSGSNRAINSSGIMEDNYNEENSYDDEEDN